MLKLRLADAAGRDILPQLRRSSGAVYAGSAEIQNDSGGLGVHNFYLGYTGKGIAQICLSFCCGIGYIWGLIEGIMIFTGNIDKDANGIPLKKDC